MYINNKWKHALLVSVCLSGSASAEDNLPGESRRSVVEEVIITATRREENLQEVGISASAFNGNQLEEMNASSAGDLAELSPNVEFKKQWGARGNSSLFYVRGVGQADFNEGSESPTTVYIDDFYIMSNSATDFLLYDVAGAEIMRGPQGALFGRNSTAGAVAVRNNQPSDELEGEIAAAIGNYDRKEFKGYFNIPVIADTLAIRFSGESEVHDGTTKNLYVGPGPGGGDTHEGDFQSARAIVKWTPSDTLSFNYKYQYGFAEGRNGGDSSQPMLTIPGDTVTVPADGFGYAPFRSGANSTHVISDGVNDFENEVDHHLATVNWDVGNAVTIKSITGYLDQSKYTLEDCDGTPRTICHAYNVVELDYWTQELRLSVDLNDARITVGGFYLDQDYENNWILPITSGTGTFQGHSSIEPEDTPGGLVQITPNTADLESYALYGNIAYDISEKVTLTGGLRWTDEERDFQQTEGLYVHDHPDTGTVSFQGNTFGILSLDRNGYRNFLANNVLGIVDPESDPEVDYRAVYEDDYFAYELSLQYLPNNELLLYGSFKHAVKSGGFNNGLVNFSSSKLDAIPFDNEENDAIEVGMKWSSSDSRVRLNAALFYYDYQDYQATAFSVENASLGVQVLNSDATVKGAEMELVANLADGFDLILGFGYVDTEVKDISKLTASGLDTADLELGQAPEFQTNGMLRYEVDLFNSGTLSNVLSFSYVGERYVDVLNDTAT